MFNVRKCRYNLPLAEHSQVRLYSGLLQNLSEIPQKDLFIHANHVEYKSPFLSDRLENINYSFIACQAPLLQNIGKFWSMVYDQNCSVIVMLTDFFDPEDNKIKADVYWPTIHRTVEFEDCYLRLTNVTYLKSTSDRIVDQSNQEDCDFVIRKFMLGHNKQYVIPHYINHIQYLKWPDHSVPTSIDGLQNLNTIIQWCSPGQSPILVHCSAGIGRTSVFISAYILLNDHQNWPPDFNDQEWAEAFGNIMESIKPFRIGFLENSRQIDYLHSFSIRIFNKINNNPLNFFYRSENNKNHV
jgi:receptor-type tyrosine-protein phosphatase eta